MRNEVKKMRNIKFLSMLVCALMVVSVFTIVVSAAPPSKPTIKFGLSNTNLWEPGDTVDVKVFSNDPDGDKIYYKIDFGDGEVTDWIGPFYSGTQYTAKHVWHDAGMYEVTATAKDVNGEESESRVKKIYISTPPELTISGPTIIRKDRIAIFDFDITDPDSIEGFSPTDSEWRVNNIDWGDGSPVEHTQWSGSKSQMAYHIYTDYGLYTIAADPAEHWVDNTVTPPKTIKGWTGDKAYFEVNVTDIPPGDPVLSGPTEGSVGTTYTFDAVVSDGIDGDAFQYFIDWGDGDDTYWIPEEPLPLGEKLSASHAWSEPGDYTIRVRAYEPSIDYYTNWVTANIHIDNLKIVGVNGGFGVSVDIHNYADISKDVDWELEAVGGSLTGFHFNQYQSGTLEPIGPDSTVTLSVPPFFGLGNFEIKVTLKATDGEVVTENINAFILFFYTIIQ